LAQKGLGADIAFRQAKAEREKAAEVLRALQETPFEVLKHLHGDKLRDMLEGYVYENLQQERMPPEQRKLLEDQKRLQMLEMQEKRRQEEDMNRKQMEAVEHYKKVYTQKVVKALDIAGLPKDAEAGERAIKYFKKAFDRGEQVTPEVVADLIREDYERSLGRTIEKLDDEEKILKLLGEKGIEKINKILSKKHQSQFNSFYPPSRQPEQREVTQKKPRHFITEDEWNSAKRTR
jgi:collagenase-like PrtC family protease